ncbi:hypothetical protein BJY04DRAFT_106002 [Aspergillus karnatakaensis]|uniref:uncharacterized protein n=1 Tax=Aspergillus karnatakaensis TaxID=1810916 RepID=UPI003CCD64C3
MPHKHKRRQNDPNTYDLPPSLIAKPLPVRDPTQAPKTYGKGKGRSRKAPGKAKPQSADTNVKSTSTKQTAGPATSRKKSALEDDTPRAFRQLMQQQARNLERAQKKRKRGTEGDSGSESESDTPVVPQKEKGKKQAGKTAQASKSTSTLTSASKTPIEEPAENRTVVKPKILPGEKLSDFAARVDREMPLADMKRSSKPAASADLPKMRDHKVTKHEKHLRRLQAQWREDDVKIREREAAEREEREEEMEDQLQLWKDWEVEAGKRKKNPNAAAGNNKKRKGGEEDDGPDPWAKLKKKRANVNPFEVAQEPPQLKKPREIFKVRGGAKVDVANVPNSVGSLRRREELASERRNIVEEYRRLMAEKRQA